MNETSSPRFVFLTPEPQGTEKTISKLLEDGYEFVGNFPTYDGKWMSCFELSLSRLVEQQNLLESIMSAFDSELQKGSV